jgi:hypothetical protein
MTIWWKMCCLTRCVSWQLWFHDYLLGVLWITLTSTRDAWEFEMQCSNVLHILGQIRFFFFWWKYKKYVIKLGRLAKHIILIFIIMQLHVVIKRKVWCQIVWLFLLLLLLEPSNCKSGVRFTEPSLRVLLFFKNIP